MRFFIYISLLFSLSLAKNHFLSYSDMCEGSKTEHCPNYRDEVRNLQKVLNADNALNLHIRVDGKWGEETKSAVIAFQKYYGIRPAKGYVGPKTKLLLSQKIQNVKLDKIDYTRHQTGYSIRSAKQFYRCYADFCQKVNLKKSYAVYKDTKLLAQAKGKSRFIKVDISEQRLRFYIDGKIALDAPCTTGAEHKFEPNTKTYRDQHTPMGTFHIQEKIADKRSTIFGDLYKGGKLIYHGDRRKYQGTWENVKFIGASLKHWMRLTSSGIRLHASKYVKRYPGTNGCIRLPYSVAHTLFAKIDKGTKVKIVR